MPIYKVTFEIQSVRHKYVRADSPEQAREAISKEIMDTDSPNDIGVCDFELCYDVSDAVETDNEGNHVPVV